MFVNVSLSWHMFLKLSTPGTRSKKVRPLNFPGTLVVLTLPELVISCTQKYPNSVYLVCANILVEAITLAAFESVQTLTSVRDYIITPSGVPMTMALYTHSATLNARVVWVIDTCFNKVPLIIAIPTPSEQYATIKNNLTTSEALLTNVACDPMHAIRQMERSIGPESTPDAFLLFLFAQDP